MSTKTVDEGGVIRYKNEKGEMHREDDPAYINGERKAWCINGKVHREDGPAYIHGDYKSWFLDGKRHRKDGPAVEHSDGDVEYWINGVLYTEDEFEHEMVKKKLERVKNL